MFDSPVITFEQAHRGYRRLRRLAYEATTRVAPAGLRPFTLTEIDPAALEAWRTTWTHRRHWTGEGGFPWDVLSRRYCRKPRCFHVAIWSGVVLCGMAVGWVSGSHGRLTLHYMESSPDPRHPLRGDITFIAFTAAARYGRAVGGHILALRNPLPGVTERYARLGFALACKQRGNLYYCKQLT